MNGDEFIGSVNDLTGKSEAGRGATSGEAKFKQDGKIDQIAGNHPVNLGETAGEIHAQPGSGGDAVSRQAKAATDAAGITARPASTVTADTEAVAARSSRDRTVFTFAVAVAGAVALSYFLGSSQKRDPRDYRD